jgi:hypothetical protein
LDAGVSLADSSAMTLTSTKIFWAAGGAWRNSDISWPRPDALARAASNLCCIGLRLARAGCELAPGAAFRGRRDPGAAAGRQAVAAHDPLQGEAWGGLEPLARLQGAGVANKSYSPAALKSQRNSESRGLICGRCLITLDFFKRPTNREVGANFAVPGWICSAVRNGGHASRNHLAQSQTISAHLFEVRGERHCGRPAGNHSPCFPGVSPIATCGIFVKAVRKIFI